MNKHPRRVDTPEERIAEDEVETGELGRVEVRILVCGDADSDVLLSAVLDDGDDLWEGEIERVDRVLLSAIASASDPSMD